MQPSRARAQAGFTLIEIMVVVVILGLGPDGEHGTEDDLSSKDLRRKAGD